MKPTRSLACLFLLPLIALPVCAEQDPGQLWSLFALEAPLWETQDEEKIVLKLEEEHRFVDAFHEHDRYHHQASILFPIPGLEGWSIEPGYRYLVEDPGDREQEQIDRYMLALHWEKEDIGGTDWKLAFRNRWEINDPDDKSEEWRTRLRVQLSHPIPCMQTAGESWTFWVYDELFYDFEVDEFNENRLAAGVTIPCSEAVSVSLGGEWRIERDEGSDADWEDDGIVLLTVRYELPEVLFPR